MRRLLGGLLATTLVAWALGSTLDATVFDREYVTAAATTSDLYGGIAATLPAALSSASGGVASQSVLAAVITPEVVQDRLEGIISGTARAWELGRRAPRLDLTDLAAQVSDLGLPVPPAVTALLQTSRVLTSPAVDRAAGFVAAASKVAGGLAPLAAAVLGVLIIVVAGHRRWTSLAVAALTAAAVVALAAAVIWLAPGFATSSLSTSNWAELAAPVRSYFDELARGVVIRLSWWGGGLAGAAVALLVAAPLLTRLMRRRPPEADLATHGRRPRR